MDQQENNYIAGQLMPLDPDWEEVAGEFVYIPAGEFIMGSSNGYDNEKPVHKVIISKSFEISRYLTTQKQWQAVMGDDTSYNAKYYTSRFKGDYLPVDNKNGTDIWEFIGRLNSKNSKYIYTLPTEAQWEYACRAGTTGDYAGDLDAMAWYKSNSEEKTHPVGQKKTNAWGLYDMHGNVWETCLDNLSAYNSEDQTDPLVLYDDRNNYEMWSDEFNTYGRDNIFIVRGGAYNSGSQQCRSASRSYYVGGSHSIDQGFRLVRIIGENSQIR